MKNYYVYVHKNSLGEVFYVGKGTGGRCHERVGRNAMWKAYVKGIERNNLTYSVDIVKTFDNEIDALRYENTLIEELLNEGKILVNKVLQLKSVDAQTLAKNLDTNVSITKNTLIGRFVKEKRRQVKLTQQKLAKVAGLGLRAVREIEAGKSTLRVDTINKALWLFGYELGPVPRQRIQ